LKKIRIISFIILCLTSTYSFGQDTDDDYLYSRTLYNIEDGLASRQVNCAIEGDEGLMWFGTRNGLNSFDGKTFELYDIKKNGFESNRIVELAKDRRGQLLVMYDNINEKLSRNVDVFDCRTHQLKYLKEAYPDSPFDSKRISLIQNDGNDVCFIVTNPFQYWRLTNTGFELECEMKQWDSVVIEFNKIHKEDDRYRDYKFRVQRSVFNNHSAILSIAQYIAIPTATYFVSKKKSKVITNDKMNCQFNTITPSGDFIYSMQYQFYKLTPQNWQSSKIDFFPPESKSNLYRCNFMQYKNQVLAMSPDFGWYLYDFHHWRKLLNFKQLNVSAQMVNGTVYSDSRNSSWITTNNGVHKINFTKKLFTHYFTRKQLDGISENQSRGIYAPSEKSVYASLWGGVAMNNKIVHSSSETGATGAIISFQNKLLFGSLKIFETEVGSATRGLFMNHTFPSTVYVLDSLSPCHLLIADFDSVYNYNTSTKKLKSLCFKSQSIALTYRLIHRKDGTIWAVAQKGLYLLDKTAEHVIDFWGKKSTDSTHRFPANVIYDAAEDADGTIWLASNNDGLYKWNRSNNTFTHFYTGNRMPSDDIFRMESDSYNNLWIGTDNGLVRFNKTTYAIRTYTTLEGLTDNEFNRTSSYIAKDGRLYMGGLDGVNAFYPKDFITDSSSFNYPMIITSFTKFSSDKNKLIDLTLEVIENKKVELMPDDKFFDIDFQLLDFGGNARNYAYQIEGWDNDWNYLKENSIRQAGLPPGNYTLVILGECQNGSWSKNILRIPIHVLYPFYRKIWFILLCVFVIALMVYSYIYYKINKLTKDKLNLELTVNTRTEQLQNLLTDKEVLLKEIHHRVKNNLQMVSGLLEMQGMKHNNEVRQILNEGRNRIHSMALIHKNLYEFEDFSSINSKKLITGLSNQVELSFSNEHYLIKRNIDVADSATLDIDTAVPFGLIVNELLTNSFKYAFQNNPNPTIDITLTVVDKGHFELVYKDNGPGLPLLWDLKTAPSIGMQIVYDLTRQIKGKVKYEYANGVKFTIQFTNKSQRKKSE